MRADHAALIANAVREHMWSDLEVCPPTGGWRTVRGDVMTGGVVQQIDSFSNGFVTKSNELHADVLDFAPYTPFARPGKDWWVRYVDLGGRTMVERLSEPMTLQDGGRFIAGPLKPADPADVVPVL